MSDEQVGAAYQQVTCRDCGRTYRATPMDDYYGSTTLSDGQCTQCLMKDAGLEGAPILVAGVNEDGTVTMLDGPPEMVG